MKKAKIKQQFPSYRLSIFPYHFDYKLFFRSNAQRQKKSQHFQVMLGFISIY